MNRFKPLSFLFGTLSLLIVLTACSGGENRVETEITPTPAATEQPASNMTVSELVARAQPAWLDVAFMRTTEQSGPIPTDGATAAFTGTIQDWVTNGNRHIVEFQDGDAINEQIYADGVVYMRGRFVSSVISPGLDINTWVIVNHNDVRPDSPVDVEARYLTRAQDDPYGPITSEIRELPVYDQGPVTVGDRTCTLYTFVNKVGETGEIHYEISIQDNGLPCQLVLRANGFQNSVVYEYDLTETVEAPLDTIPVNATPEG